MKELRESHRLAMEQSDLALVARMRGEEDVAAQHLQSAFELESRAANALLNDLGVEPTRSVLYRSAATLARDCGHYEDAQRLIYRALSGKPPNEISIELQDLLEQVTFQRHLELRGITLGDEEVQMAITGSSVGFGMAPTDVILGRVQSIEALLYRTGERTLNRAYREKSRRDVRVTQDLELLMSVPRAASFAVTFRVGGGNQQSLPGLSHGERVIDELLDCLQLYVTGDESQLKERIREESYYRNFIGLARTLQPDGRKVNMVGFTTIRQGRTKQVAMTRPMVEKFALPPTEATIGSQEPSKGGVTLVELRGELKVANATKITSKQSGEIEIITAENDRIRVSVPPGMMSDIVKPLWDSEVEITGTRRGNAKKIHLVQIRAAP